MNPEWVTAVFTGVLTLATICYVIFTLLLWLSTKKSADAAMVAAESARSTAEATKVSADAAMLSADMLVELNRPILGIASVAVVQASWDSLGSTASTIVVTLQNYGTFYAKGVLVEWTAYMQALNETRNTARQGPIDIAQGASCPIILSVWVKAEDGTRMRTGSEHYKIQIRAEYSAPNDKRRWKYTAVRALNLPSTFTMDDQVPDCTETIL